LYRFLEEIVGVSSRQEVRLGTNPDYRPAALKQYEFASLWWRVNLWNLYLLPPELRPEGVAIQAAYHFRDAHIGNLLGRGRERSAPVPGSGTGRKWGSILDAVAREGAQRMLVGALEQEFEEFLGRAGSVRQPGRRERGYRNGVGKVRKIAVGCGTLEIRPPRARDTKEPFRWQPLPRYRQSSESIRALLPELYLQGLVTGDFEPALRSFLGEAAPPWPVVDRAAQGAVAGGVRGLEASSPGGPLCLLLRRRTLFEGCQRAEFPGRDLGTLGVQISRLLARRVSHMASHLLRSRG